MELLKFSNGNAKLKDRLIFSLPAGHSCPWAGSCRTFASRDTGEIIDHPTPAPVTAYSHPVSDFRCFAVMSETRPSVRKARWHNWDLIRTTLYKDGDQVQNLKDLIHTSLTVQKPKQYIRVHESGDFWTDNYFRAWMAVATERPKQIFYAYTKSLLLWYQFRDEVPDNFKLTASYGGRLDDVIHRHKDVYKRYAQVVYTEQEAMDLGLEIDHDDSHCLGDKPFALLVHGVQRAGSDASKALSQRRKDGSFSGYNKTNTI